MYSRQEGSRGDHFEGAGNNTLFMVYFQVQIFGFCLYHMCILDGLGGRVVKGGCFFVGSESTCWLDMVEC